MDSTDTKSILKKAIRFHGQQCPGLAMGLRVSRVALRELGKPAKDEELVAIVENSSCGEPTMETWIRLPDGAPHCIPCFEELMI